MKKYRLYSMNGDKLKKLCTLCVKNNTTLNELETILERFIKNNYEQLYNELLELVLVNTETNKPEHRFNLVRDWDNFEDPTLYPALDILESDFLYWFIEAYENTYGAI